MIVTDVARNAGTNRLGVEVVSDAEITEAESADTISRFIQEHENDD